MADEIDRASDVTETWNAANIAATARDMPKGEPGECAECGYYYERTVGGLCARCREELGRG